MLDKAQLGQRYVCFQCGTKFYDLNRPVPNCPECSADQRDAPVRDIKALLSGRSRLRDDDEDDIEPGEEDDDLAEDDEFAEEDDEGGGTEEYDDEGGGEEESFDDE